MSTNVFRSEQSAGGKTGKETSSRVAGKSDVKLTQTQEAEDQTETDCFQTSCTLSFYSTSYWTDITVCTLECFGDRFGFVAS